MKNLTQQQKLFVSEYIKSLDGILSAKKAGYKTKDLKGTADRLLSYDFVINEIKLQIKRHISSLNVQKGYVIQKLLQIAEFSLQEEDITDKDGNSINRNFIALQVQSMAEVEDFWLDSGIFTLNVNHKN